MNTKKNEGSTTQKNGKGKMILTTAGAVVVGAVAGKVADRLFQNDSDEAILNPVEEEQIGENSTVAQEQMDSEAQQVNSNDDQQVSQNTSSHSANAIGGHNTGSHTAQAGGHNTGSHTAQAGNGGDAQTGADAEVVNNQDVEAEAVAVAERLVGDVGTPNEVDYILNVDNEDVGVLYTENGTEIPVAEFLTPNDENTLTEMPEEDIPDELFEEGGFDSPANDTNEVADIGLEIEFDNEIDTKEM